MTDLLSCRLDVGILCDNSWVVATAWPDQLTVLSKECSNLQFESDPFQGLGGACHHKLACGRRSCEADLVDTRMRCQPGAEIVVSADDLENTFWEEALPQLSKLEIAIRGKRRRLDDDGIPGDQRRCYFSAGKMDREIPRNDASRDSKWHISNNYLLLSCFLNNFGVKLQLSKLPHPENTDLNLLDSKSNL